MIKMKVYENRREQSFESSCYAEYMFGKFSSGLWGSRGKPPFRDPESLRLMKESYNIEFVEGAWYSVMCQGERMSITDISSALKYALVLLHYSRERRFLSGEYLCYDEIWTVLSDMPFDILISCTWEDLWLHGSIFCGKVPFLIVNYPLFGERIELFVNNEEIGEEDPFYRKLYDEHVFDRSYRIFMGADKRYYSDFRLNLGYHWKEDIDGILKYIDNLEPVCRLAEFNDVYSVKEFAERAPEAARDSYCFVPDHIKIINHMYLMPRVESIGRKMTVLIVEKNYNGSYRTFEGLTVKYPEHGEILEDAATRGHADGELFILYVDLPGVVEKLCSAEDLDQTVWAIRVYEDRIELFDKYDGLKLFAAAVREALASGNCEISKGLM